MKLVIAVLAILLTGCSTLSLIMPTQVQYDKGDAQELNATSHSSFTLPEAAWHAMNVIDMGQTLNVANSPSCYRESNPLTKALIGEHPSQGDVILSSLAYSVGYRMLSEYLQRHDTLDENGDYTGWHDAYYLFQSVMLATKAYTIWNNNEIGLRPFGKAVTC